jgi:site-specific DNA-methyltransferase (cytosine-N4-specific)
MIAESEWHNGNLLVGDVLDKITEIPDKSVDCIISSPPYWGLRDYGVSDQWGSEPDYQHFLLKLDRLMDENKRILKDTGTCWINLGDTYSTGMEEMADKSRVGVPERFYINCIDAGWIARNHIVWAKPAAMPTSVKDRFQNRWESIFFFAKQGKYYFNLDAVREIPFGGYAAFNRRIRDAKKLNQMGLDGAMTSAIASEKEIAEYGNHQPGERSHFGCGRDIDTNREKSGNDDQGKNPGDILWINSKPFKEAHFATFPEELPEMIIKCACPPGGVVFDPFMGSGTVAAVALKNNRKWLGIELNPEYVKIIKKRLDGLSSDTMEQFFE